MKALPNNRMNLTRSAQQTDRRGPCRLSRRPRWGADETRLGEGTMPELERTFRAARF